MSYKDLFGMAQEEIVEPSIVEKGEYTLRISSAEDKMSKKGRGMYALVFHITDSAEENPAPVFHYLMKVMPGDDNETMQRYGQQSQKFVEAFGVDTDVEPEEFCESLIGLEGMALLDIESDDEFGDKNRVKRFITR